MASLPQASAAVPTASLGPQARLLRVGVIQNGRIIEERLIRHDRPVTFGQSPSATLAVPSDGLPRSWPLFEKHGGRYVARVRAGMDARIGVGGDIVSLDELRRRHEASARDGEVRVPLPDRARGKVTAGDVTVLFQLVKPPVAVPRPRLPASLRATMWGRLDRFFGVVVVASLAAHIALVAYLRSVDWPRRPGIENVPDTFLRTWPKRPLPKTLPVRPKTQPEVATGPRQPSTPHAAPARPAHPPALQPPRPTAEERRAALADEVRKMGAIALLTARTAERGSIVDSILHGAPERDQEEAMRGISGLSVATTDNRLANLRPTGTGRVVRIGKIGRGFGPIEGADTGTATEHTVVRTPGPVDWDPKRKDVDPAAIARDVKSRMGGVKSCYEHVLKRNPALAGKIVLRWTITEAGTVSGVEVEDDSVGDPELVDCLRKMIGHWRFAAPPGGAIEVTFPFVFQPAA